MNSALNSRPESSRQHMRVEIAEQQHQLKKQQADDPNRRAASKPRQDNFGDERLYLKQKEGARKNRDAVEQF